MPRPETLAEAERVMTICNACRYCEGHCAVFPAMELRLAFAAADLNYLANLCHDCGACFHALPVRAAARVRGQRAARVRRAARRDLAGLRLAGVSGRRVRAQRHRDRPDLGRKPGADHALDPAAGRARGPARAPRRRGRVLRRDPASGHGRGLRRRRPVRAARADHGLSAVLGRHRRAPGRARAPRRARARGQRTC